VAVHDGVWIGTNATVLPGVTIGKKAVIGAGSVVSRDIPAYCVTIGNPCRQIKLWNQELKAFE
jgi:maltose O-acetyltransferase